MSGNSQEAKADAGKLRPSLVPVELITGVAEVRDYGTKKYKNGGDDNWRQVEAQRLWDAALRHALAAWHDWKKTDPESGMLHIKHMATNLAFLLAFYNEEEKDGE